MMQKGDLSHDAERGVYRMHTREGLSHDAEGGLSHDTKRRVTVCVRLVCAYNIRTTCACTI
jgi:hypothetical protein